MGGCLGILVGKGDNVGDDNGDSIPTKKAKQGEHEVEGESSPPNASPNPDPVVEEAEVEAVIGEELHPLLNEVVLRNVFKYYSGDLELLGDSRLVCKTWRDVSLPTWRALATPRILFAKKRQIYCLIDTDARETSLDEFLELLEGEGQVTPPYRQFHLIGWTFHGQDGGDASAIRFWEMVGGHLTKLTLQYCESAKPEDFLRITNQLCPNLGALILDTCEFCDRDIWDKKREVNDGADREYKEPTFGEHQHMKSLQLIYDDSNVTSHLRVSFLELLSHFPGLTAFKLETEYSELRPEIIHFLEAVKTIRAQDPGKLPISELDTGGETVHFNFWVRGIVPPWDLGFVVLDGDGNGDGNRDGIIEVDPLVDNVMRLLQELGITLKSIILNSETLIQFNGPSLTKIIIRKRRHQRCPFPFGVELPNLEELEFVERFCKDFGFIRFTPNLKSLRISDDSRDYSIPIQGQCPMLISSTASTPELDNIRLMNLSTLKLEDFTVRADDLHCLIKWMPNVKNLWMDLDNEQFGIVCGNWRKLVELHATGRGLTDKGVIGMTTESHGEGSGEGEQAIVPNVTWLKNLEVFDAPGGTLTDVSLFHGLLKLKRLRRVFLSYEIGGEATEILHQRGIQISEFDNPGLIFKVHLVIFFLESNPKYVLQYKIIKMYEVP